MRQVLGSMYDKYNKFKICCASIGIVNNASNVIEDRIVNVNLSGLSFTNRQYDSTGSSSTNSAIMTCLSIINTNGLAFNFTGEIGVMFEKPVSSLLDLTIFFTRVTDGVIPTTTYGNGNFVAAFIIYGIDDDEQ